MKILSNLRVFFFVVILHHFPCVTCPNTFWLFSLVYDFAAPSILMLHSINLQLGLVIDLTNTTRYYPVSDWTKEGIRHVKVAYDLSCYWF